LPSGRPVLSCPCRSSKSGCDTLSEGNPRQTPRGSRSGAAVASLSSHFIEIRPSAVPPRVFQVPGRYLGSRVFGVTTVFQVRTLLKIELQVPAHVSSLLQAKQPVRRRAVHVGTRCGRSGQLHKKDQADEKIDDGRGRNGGPARMMIVPGGAGPKGSGVEHRC
jgi:hypothetical protein